MDIKLQKGQVVWAKVRGFAWWPGVVTYTQVSEIHQELDSVNKPYKITVHFIGENSHSVLPYDKVADYKRNYAKYSKTSQKVISTQWLKKCIKVADKVLSRKIALKDLPLYNENLKSSYVKKREEKKDKLARITKIRRSRASSVDTRQESTDRSSIDKKSISDSQIQDLDNKLAAKIKTKQSIIHCHPRILSQIGIKSKLLASQKLLYGFIHHFAPEEIKPEKLTIDNLYDCLNELVSMDISPQQLESCKLLRLVKVFKEDFIYSKDKKLQDLAKIAHKLYLYWKSLLIGYELDKLSKEEAQNEVHVVEDEPKPEIQSVSREETKLEVQPPVRRKRGRPAKNKIQTPVEIPNKMIKQTPQSEIESKQTKQQVIEESRSEETVESVPKNESSDLVLHEVSESISPLIQMKIFENRELRKSLLRRIAKILQQKGLTKQESRERAMNIDRKIKEIDSDFGDKYISLLQKFKRYIEKLPQKIEKDHRIDIESLTLQFYIQD